jgi:hypothetical protein
VVKAIHGRIQTRQAEKGEEMTKVELLEENDALIELLEDINDAIELPDDLQDRIDEFLVEEEVA